jgi:predicted DNA-binding transcriptional regulator AlpA
MDSTSTSLKSVRDTAVYLGVSVSTLNKWRVFGNGPRFCRLGRRVAYRQKDIDEFVAGNLRRSTSDPGEAEMEP